MGCQRFYFRGDTDEDTWYSIVSYRQLEGLDWAAREPLILANRIPYNSSLADYSPRNRITAGMWFARLAMGVGSSAVERVTAVNPISQSSDADCGASGTSAGGMVLSAVACISNFASGCVSSALAAISGPAAVPVSAVDSESVAGSEQLPVTGTECVAAAHSLSDAAPVVEAESVDSASSASVMEIVSIVNSGVVADVPCSSVECTSATLVPPVAAPVVEGSSVALGSVSETVSASVVERAVPPPQLQSSVEDAIHNLQPGGLPEQIMGAVEINLRAGSPYTPRGFSAIRRRSVSSGFGEQSVSHAASYGQSHDSMYGSHGGTWGHVSSQLDHEVTASDTSSWSPPPEDYGGGVFHSQQDENSVAALAAALSCASDRLVGGSTPHGSDAHECSRGISAGLELYSPSVGLNLPRLEFGLPAAVPDLHVQPAVASYDGISSLPRPSHVGLDFQLGPPPLLPPSIEMHRQPLPIDTEQASEAAASGQHFQSIYFQPENVHLAGGSGGAFTLPVPLDATIVPQNGQIFGMGAVENLQTLAAAACAAPPAAAPTPAKRRAGRPFGCRQVKNADRPPGSVMLGRRRGSKNKPRPDGQSPQSGGRQKRRRDESIDGQGDGAPLTGQSPQPGGRQRRRRVQSISGQGGGDSLTPSLVDNMEDQPELSEYELQRLQNMSYNSTIFRELGLGSYPVASAPVRQPRPRSSAMGTTGVSGHSIRLHDVFVRGRFDGNYNGWVYDKNAGGYLLEIFSARLTQCLPSNVAELGMYTLNGLFMRWEVTRPLESDFLSDTFIQNQPPGRNVTDQLRAVSRMRMFRGNNHLTADAIKPYIFLEVTQMHAGTLHIGNLKYCHGKGQYLYGDGLYVKYLKAADYELLRGGLSLLSWQYKFRDATSATPAGFFYMDMGDYNWLQQYPCMHVTPRMDVSDVRGTHVPGSDDDE